MFHHVLPRLSKNLHGPFDELEANQSFMHILGQLSTDLRLLLIRRESREVVKGLLRQAKHHISGLATGEEAVRERHIADAFQILTRTLDHTFVHHLDRKQSALFSEWLLEVMEEDLEDGTHLKRYFTKDVFNHLATLAHRLR